MDPCVDEAPVLAELTAASVTEPSGARARPRRTAAATGGDVRLSLRQPWSDGTTDSIFTPISLLERLAVLVPRPRINLVLYFGALGARAAGRSSMVGRGASQSDPEAPAVSPVGEGAPEGLRARGHQWAELMARTSGSMCWPARAAAGGYGSSR